MSKARVVKVSRPVMVPRGVDVAADRVEVSPAGPCGRRAGRTSTPPGRRRFWRPGPSGVNGRWAMPRKPGSVPRGHAAQADEGRDVDWPCRRELGDDRAERRVMAWPCG